MESPSSWGIVVSNAFVFEMKPSEKLRIQTDYLHKVFRPHDLRRTVNSLDLKIGRLHKKLGFDSIAFTGMSGSAVAYPLSFKSGVPLICVRKGEKRHSVFRVEGNLSCKNYIIVDDTVSSGDTVRRIIKSIKDNIPNAKCVGVVLYDYHITLKQIRVDGQDIPIYCPRLKVKK